MQAHEAQFKEMEEEAPNALEMAEKAHEKGKEKKAGEGIILKLENEHSKA
ncbi:hypothetical protein HZB88_04565 [archaeon]|nr:hypothetical protein [archaeon]